MTLKHVTLMSIMLFGLLLAGCTQYGNATPTPPAASPAPTTVAAATPAPSTQTAAISNPASTHCLALNYREKFEDAQGLCVFPDGSSCESWSFLRGKCGSEFSACAKQPGATLLASEEYNRGSLFAYGKCVFADDSQCPEDELASGRCKPGQCSTWSVASGCQNEEPTTQIANPAATHCVQLGYQNKIVDSAEGQSGACVFPDGWQCDDWKFYRGECGQSFSACAKAGGKLGATLMGPNGPVTSNSTCQFSDGTTCEEADLAANTCRPGQQAN